MTQRPAHPFGLSFHLKGRMSDVLPCLCERWCSISWLMEITGGTKSEVRTEIKAIREHYVVEEAYTVERTNPNIHMGAEVGRVGVIFRVTGKRDHPEEPAPTA